MCKKLQVTKKKDNAMTHPHEPLTLAPHWGDNARDWYWANALTLKRASLLFCVGFGVGAAILWAIC